MGSLLMLWLFAALPGLLWASHSTLIVEGDNDASRICKPAPQWDIKGYAPMRDLLGNVAVVALLYPALYLVFHLFIRRIGGLRDRLNRSNMTEVSFIIVNERDAHSRAMYWELKRSAPTGVPVFQQQPLQNDVWEALDGDKDDFLVYDRCGLLTFHIVMPYSFLHHPFVEAAIRATYQKNICNCTLVDEGSEVADTASGGTHHHHHHDHHHDDPPSHQHHHDQHSSHQNQSLHQQDQGDSTSHHHHHHSPHQQHQHDH
uniref:Selenoprotein P2 n=1 Tax=Maylandia zebra TaxID=106582 RepID=A0A3P9C9X8_9CICH